MLTFEENIARYSFAAVRLDERGRVLERCSHDHGRHEAAAIACARELGWDGFAELLVTDDGAKPAKRRLAVLDATGSDAPEEPRRRCGR